MPVIEKKKNQKKSMPVIEKNPKKTKEIFRGEGKDTVYSGTERCTVPIK